jgi:phytoene synthase
MNGNFEHCAALVREADHDRFLASLFAPEADRNALYALYAFNAEIARVRDAVREPLTGEIRLQWWQEVLAGERRGEEKAHPVAAALRIAVEQYGIDVQQLSALVDAHASDFYEQPFAGLQDLEAYAEKTEATVFAIAADVLGGRSVATSAVIRHAGISYTIAGLLRNFVRNAAHGRLYVPLDLMMRHGAAPQKALGGERSDELRMAIGELRIYAQNHLDAARADFPALQESTLPAILPVASVRPLLMRLEKIADDPFRLTPAPRWQRQWRMWRAAHKPGRIFE